MGGWWRGWHAVGEQLQSKCQSGLVVFCFSIEILDSELEEGGTSGMAFPCRYNSLITEWRNTPSTSRAKTGVKR